MQDITDLKRCIVCEQDCTPNRFTGRRNVCKTCYNVKSRARYQASKAAQSGMARVRSAEFLTLADISQQRLQDNSKSVPFISVLQRLPQAQKAVYDRLVTSRLAASLKIGVTLRRTEIIDLQRDSLLFVLTFGSNAQAEADALDAPIPAQPPASYSSLRAYDYGLPLWLDVE